MARSGVAFSGGGLRSASFCAGVLRRLLQTNSRIDHLSCVSGGGVTATSYLDWKFRNDQRDNPEWHKEFFEHMRKRIGAYLNFSGLWFGLLDVLLLLAVVAVLSIIFPILFFSSFAGPIAYSVNLAFGRFLRGNFICRINGTVIVDSEADNCQANNSFDTLSPVHTLLLVLASSFLCVYLIKPLVGSRLSPLLNFLQRILGFIFLMVSIPWIQQQFYTTTDSLWFRMLIIVGSALVMLSLPPFRGMASSVIMVYLYADIIRWRVFKVPILGLRFTHDYFSSLLWASLILLVLTPFLGVMQKGLLHVLIRWKLQKAFYTEESVGWSGCSGVECSDFFPLPRRHRPRDNDNQDRPLTLGDLKDIKPELICNVLVDNWKIDHTPEVPNYELLTLTPTIIERLDRKKEQRQFEGLLTPSDIKLSSAMATSVAAISLHMGVYQDTTAAFRDIQAILGLTFGNDIVVGRKSLASTIISAALQIIVFAPLVLLPPFQVFRRLIPEANTVVAVWFAVNFILFTLISLIPSATFDGNLLQRFARWCHVYIYHVSFIRNMLSVVTIGNCPPAILNLSDGGHYENLGILPLFKRRLEKIVVVNGGYTETADKSADDLLFALELARKKLNCSFLGIDGRDIIEDVRHNFVNKQAGKQPRYYRFKVDYYDENCKVGEGEVILLHPRHPSAGHEPSIPHKSWKSFGIDLDPNLWGSGPEIQSEEVDRLVGCCCSCCHGSSCGCLSKGLCGVFPNHSTANQALTPEMFVAYHREGYRACVEAEADDFLNLGKSQDGNVRLEEI